MGYSFLGKSLEKRAVHLGTQTLTFSGTARNKAPVVRDVMRDS